MDTAKSREAYILKQEKKVKSSSSINTVKFPIATVFKRTLRIFLRLDIRTYAKNHRRYALGAQVRIRNVLTGTSEN